MGLPSSRVSHQACSFELDPRELSSNGILGNRGLIHVGAFGSQGACSEERDSCIHGLLDISRDPPADRESDSALAELLSGSTLADQSSRGMLFVLGLLVLVFFADYTPVNLELYKPCAQSCKRFVQAGTWIERPRSISRQTGKVFVGQCLPECPLPRC